MTISAVIACADDFVAIAKSCRMEEWFARFLDMSEGVPSHDRFNVRGFGTPLMPCDYCLLVTGWLID